MLPLKLAIRYIFSPKSSSIVNLIAIVSAVALSLTVAAALFTISLQCGLEKFVAEMYGSIDPKFRIERLDGGQFDRHLLNDQDVGIVSFRKDVNVIMECGENRAAAVLSGVDSSFCLVTGIDGIISSGRNPIPENSYGILIGRGIAYELGIASGVIKLVKVSSIKKHKGFFSSIPFVKSIDMLPVGVYSLDQSTDSRYAFAHISRIDELTGDSSMVTSLELLPHEGLGKEDIARLLPEGYIIKDSSDIRATIFFMIGKEKGVIFAILMLIALLASMSLAGTVSVMIREKSDDIVVFKILGYTIYSVRKVFFMVGFSITLISVFIGTILGSLLTYTQKEFGFLTMGGTTFMLDSYPVAIDPIFWAATILTSIAMGAAVSLFSSFSDKL